MQSLLKLCTAAALLCMVQAAALRQHQLRGGELDRRQPRPPFRPSTEMAKALEYIESLRQQRDGPVDDGDGDKIHSQWWQVAAARDRAAQREDAASKQLLKTLLTSLQGAIEDPKPAKNVEDGRKTTDTGDYGRYPFPKHSKLLKKYPLMFEDKDARESPYKRTNENVEPQYTPQSLATLQSVFQDLGKLSTSKDYKRQSLDQELFRGGDDDLYRFNNLAYEDVVGGGDWTPMEEMETEEEIKDSREEFDRGLDNSDDDDDDDDDDDEDDVYDDDDDDDDEDEENYVKRSSQQAKYRGKEDPEDFDRLVDYYLLKILEKTDQTEQKREEQDVDRRSVRPSYDMDPQAMYQLIEISHKLQVHPEDLVELLMSAKVKKQKKVPVVPEEETDDLEQVEEKLTQISTYNKDKGRTTKYNGRRLPEVLANNLKILNILGIETRGSEREEPLHQQRNPKNTQTKHYIPSGRQGNTFFPDPSISDKKESDYYDTVDEDELAMYLAAKMLSQYPKVKNKTDLKHPPQPSPKDETIGTFEQAVLNYFDQLASEKRSPSKRLPKTDGIGDSPQMQHLDDETLLKMLEYLNPETSENEERNLYRKSIGGM